MKRTANIANIVTLVVICIGLTGLNTTALAANDKVSLPAGTLKGEQIVELFSGNTVESITAVRERTSISYYNPNGEVRQTRKGVKRYGHWWVTDNDRICLQMEKLPEKCRIIVYEDGEYRKYIVKKDGNHQHSVTYRSFMKGNPYGL